VENLASLSQKSSSIRTANIALRELNQVRCKPFVLHIASSISTYLQFSSKLDLCSSFLTSYLHPVHPQTIVVHMIITRVMILGLELRLPYSYDFSKVTSCSKKFVAGSIRIFQLIVQVLKVKINFKCKKASTGKFAVNVVKGIANWYFGTIWSKFVHNSHFFIKIFKF
jgi:hypothetical protein